MPGAANGQVEQRRSLSSLLIAAAHPAHPGRTRSPFCLLSAFAADHLNYQSELPLASDRAERRFRQFADSLLGPFGDGARPRSDGVSQISNPRVHSHASEDHHDRHTAPEAVATGAADLPVCASVASVVRLWPVGEPRQQPLTQAKRPVCRLNVERPEEVTGTGLIRRVQPLPPMGCPETQAVAL